MRVAAIDIEGTVVLKILGRDNNRVPCGPRALHGWLAAGAAAANLLHIVASRVSWLFSIFVVFCRDVADARDCERPDSAP